MDTVKNAGSGEIPLLNPYILGTISGFYTLNKFVPVVSTNSVSLWKSR